jgi:DNA-directed RNA polymerase subunit RPC12/RpoP
MEKNSLRNEIVTCPHCQVKMIILELNCKIFRHGVYKSNFQQIDSHMDKNECERLVSNNLIYGCGKPFRIDDNNNAIVCEYI